MQFLNFVIQSGYDRFFYKSLAGKLHCFTPTRLLRDTTATGRLTKKVHSPSYHSNYSLKKALCNSNLRYNELPLLQASFKLQSYESLDKKSRAHHTTQWTIGER